MTTRMLAFPLALIAVAAVLVPATAEAGKLFGGGLKPAAARSAAPRTIYRGDGMFRTSIQTKKRTAAAAEQKSGDLSFAIHDGIIAVQIDKPDEQWRQGFLVTSDTTDAAGRRTITFNRPETRTRLAQLNLKAVNTVQGVPWPVRTIARVLGGYKTLDGGGQITIEGDRVTWSNSGTGTMRLGLATHEVSWNDSFFGTATR